jgi:hypothetical protein
MPLKSKKRSQFPVTVVADQLHREDWLPARDDWLPAGEVWLPTTLAALAIPTIAKSTSVKSPIARNDFLDSIFSQYIPQ